ncbi:hypothetical protein CFBP4996_26335 (plasmid) [Agrobacterium leguminum]|uniref:hypothetical protein n=1 Tax=Agrobacterium leguminum TaxID=2792015 RepID=UPI0010CA16A2|nr:hypothetical protein [Agrobacterium leguminum]WFS69594.1 hypothetical protein CFBP4996_26335 [Agrobacterium leguminum]
MNEVFAPERHGPALPIARASGMSMYYGQLAKLLASITAAKQIPEFNKLLWTTHGHGHLSDDEADQLSHESATLKTSLDEAREKRMPPTRSYFPQRTKSGRSREDAASGSRCSVRWARKRRLGDMAALPPHVRDRFTEGERAVLYIVASDYRHHNACSSSVKEIGDRAGVGVTTVRNTLRKARHLGLLLIQERPQWRAKNLTNVIKIVCAQWLGWIRKFRPNLGLKFYPIGFKKPESSGTFGTKKINGQPSYSRSDGPPGRFQRFASRKPPTG